ncbi:unnamed protein product [Closterium sp. Naga37s-1]|nr:unnamed protein product [Closterium sp. Naga37s-1]
MWVQLVRHLAERQTPGFPKNGYGAYYTRRDGAMLHSLLVDGHQQPAETVEATSPSSNTPPLLSPLPSLLSCPHHVLMWRREALAAKDTATVVPELGLIDTMVKELAEYLGRSHPSHDEFKELQEVFYRTNLELQEIHAVRWLSYGDAIMRLVHVLPVVIVLLWEWDDDFYHIVTSVKFNVYLYYLADMLIILNNLNLQFQKREVDMTSVQSTVHRTLITIRTRYIEFGDDFGGGPQQHLRAFLARLSKSRKITVDGGDGEGRPRQHSFELHEEALTGYIKSPDDLQPCLDVCRRHA